MSEVPASAAPVSQARGGGARSQAEVVVFDLLGAAIGLLASARTWQTVTVRRSRPLADEVLDVHGRVLDALPLAVSLVALAGAVALLATRGAARRVVGAILLLDGALLVWRSARGLVAVGDVQARSLAVTARSGVGIDSASPVHVTVHALWPVASVVAGVLTVAAGAWALARAHRWSAMSARYDAPAAALTDASLWNAIDRGDDPTARTET